MRGAVTEIVCVRNQTRGTILCARATLALGLHSRTRGLLGRVHLDPDEGMLFEAGSLSPLMWMHTFFMSFPIDIVFLGRGNQVTKIQASLKPGRFSTIAIGARKALELGAGVAANAETEVGDFVSIERVSI